MIVNLNSSINYRDMPIMDGFKIINSSSDYIFKSQDFFILDDNFFEIDNNGIINIKKNITCDIFGTRASSNNIYLTNQNFFIRENDIVKVGISFPMRSQYESSFSFNNVSFMMNDKIKISYEGVVQGYPIFCKFYLKIV